MQLTTIIPDARVEDIVQAVECVLEWHLVENNFGAFRWQRDSCDNARYRLEFRSAYRFLWFKVHRKSCVVLSLRRDATERNNRVHLRWQIKSLRPGTDLCELIVRETELEIANVLAESSLGGIHHNDG